MIPARITLITIGALDVAGLRSFYLRLGWTETEISSDRYAVFQTSGVLLSIYPLDELCRDAGIDYSESTPAFKGSSLAINVENAQDVDAVIDGVRELGGRILKDADDIFWGGRVGYFMDPENNLWEVAWNPTAVFNEYGAMVSF